ncbi:MAG: DUF4190 domain-containing protein [Planctomycetaceae bacterium]
MSESTLDMPLPNLAPSGSESNQSGWAEERNFDEFDYTPVSPWGPVALVLGLGSLTGLTNSVFGLGLALIGVIIGITAVIRIRATGGAYKGTGFAVTGAILSAVCLVAGSAKLSYAYEHEVPEGYLRVNFPKQISAHQFVYPQGRRRLHPDVAPLVGQKLFLKGYMWQTQKAEGLESFVFLKDNGECCFGGSPQPYDMMVVHMADGKTTRAYSGMVAVSGILNADVTAKEGDPVYTVDADIVEEAQTSF